MFRAATTVTTAAAIKGLIFVQNSSGREKNYSTRCLMKMSKAGIKEKVEFYLLF